jgi:C_GCAxxG_C_C family probable redox protein
VQFAAARGTGRAGGSLHDSTIVRRGKFPSIGDGMNSLSEVAVAKMLEGYNCAQAVLFASCERLPMNPDAALRIACGLGAGLGRRQEVCGALTGAIVALGVRYGRGDGEDRSRTEETYARTRELISRFEAKHGCSRCRELLGGCDLTTEDGLRYYKANDLLHITCVPCVRTAATILEGMLDSAPPPR